MTIKMRVSRRRVIVLKVRCRIGGVGSSSRNDLSGWLRDYPAPGEALSNHCLASSCYNQGDFRLMTDGRERPVILNSYAVLDAFLTLLRLIIALVVVVVGVRAMLR